MGRPLGIVPRRPRADSIIVRQSYDGSVATSMATARIAPARIERLEACGDHVGLVIVYQDRARIARLLQDRPGLNTALSSMRHQALLAGSPALILLADRTAELRAQHIYSPLPERPGEAQQTTARSSTQHERAVTRFLRGCRSSTERSRHALQMLARYGASDEVYLFSCVQGEVKTVAALEDRPVPEELTTKIRELLERSAGSAAGAYAMVATELSSQSGESVRFRLILLASRRAGEGYLGVAAMRESEPSSAELSEAMLADLCAVLVDNMRLQQTQNSRSTDASS
jgi:hypothetical protein